MSPSTFVQPWVSSSAKTSGLRASSSVSRRIAVMAGSEV
jgi:hypothetical protein